MKEFANFKQFAAFMNDYEHTLPVRMLQVAESAALVTKLSIKEVFGDKERLAELRPRTIELREDGGDSPLLIDGHKLRDSIESAVEPLGGGAVAGVGSSEPVVVYSEHGFWNELFQTLVVPRPAFAIGVYEALPQVKELLVLLAPSAAGISIKTARGRFASAENPDAMLTGTKNPAALKSDWDARAAEMGE